MNQFNETGGVTALCPRPQLILTLRGLSHFSTSFTSVRLSVLNTELLLERCPVLNNQKELFSPLKLPREFVP